MIYEDFDSVDVVEITMLKGEKGDTGPHGLDGSGAAYEEMSQAEANARTETMRRVISAKVLGNSIISDDEYSNLIKNDGLFESYSTSKGYKKGDIVVNENDIYEANQDIASPAGTFSTSKWKKMDVRLYNLFKSLSNRNSFSDRRRIIFIGDSYGRGESPYGTTQSWIEKTATTMKLDSGDYYNFSVNGAGFLNGTTFKTILQQNVDRVTNFSTITDIVVGGGFNDRSYTGENLSDAVVDFANYARSIFSKARIWIAPIGWCRSVSDRKKIVANVFNGYSDGAHRGGCILIGEAKCILHNYSYMLPDYVHPTSEGQGAIDDVISNVLMGGGGDTKSTTRKYEYVSMLFTKNSTSALSSYFNYVASCMMGDTCYLWMDSNEITGSAIACDGSKYTLGTVDGGHFGGYRVNADFDSMRTPCWVERNNANVYVPGYIDFFFEEFTDSGKNGVFLCAKFYATTGTGWVTDATKIFGFKASNLSLPATEC